nr:MAG TPA: hypothetical protein [Crassvirales sp.]
MIVTKVEKIKNMVYGVNLSIITMHDQQQRLP